MLTAGVQITGGCVLGVFVFMAMGLPIGANGRWDALYLGVAAALSSTVIIVKILYDKRELDTLAGRVTLGVLVLQDLFAILFLAVQPSLGELKFESSWPPSTGSGCWSFRRCSSAALRCRFCFIASPACRNWWWSARWHGASSSANWPRALDSRARWAR